ncbi:ATP-binding protein [Sphingomonas sp.]|uniref:ATP-binding protein n=1 Tax=Sphingomonas sp. TaxID=28214 RepID=UPI002D7EE7C3|nr:ATP-binding protein [Sphingomonas sp.]HEU0045808.1 ATP-binding protein [Sphingomonas sp.]
MKRLRLAAERWTQLPLFAGGFALLLLIAGLAIIFQSARSYRTEQEGSTRVQAEILSASVVAALDFSDRQVAQEVVNALRANPEIREAMVFDRGGRLFAGFSRDNVGGSGVIKVVVSVANDGGRLGTVRLVRAEEPVARRVARYSLIGLFVVMAALIAGILGLAANALRRANRQLGERAAALGQMNEALTVQIAEREKAEEQLRQAQKMQALGQLTGGIAHDFNNLLTVIQGSADLLQRPGLDEVKRMRFAGAIAQTAARAASLTSQLLAFARRQPLKPEVMDVNERIASMSEIFERSLGTGVSVVTEFEADGCIVEADPAQLESAILNVAVNARDAMPSGGTLTIRTYTGRLNEVRKAVAIAVSDTGGGMDPEIVSRVFEPFFTTKGVGKGTGLGLSQVYGFASQSGGDVTIDSAPGKGTTVTILLPCSERKLGRQQLRQAHATSPPTRRRLLVVDDNEEVGAFAETLLGELGHDVARASSAQEALKLAAAGHFDLVFTDVVMPEMSGIELALELRRRGLNAAIVLTTGYSDRIAETGSEGFPVITKPYRLETLADTIERALREEVLTAAESAGRSATKCLRLPRDLAE